MNSCILMLEEAARRAPNGVAAVDEAGRYTFRELRDRAIQFARQVPEDWRNQPIGVHVPKSADCLVAFFGVLYSGNFYVPLDVRSPAPRLNKVLKDLGPRAIVTTEKGREALGAALTGIQTRLWDAASLMRAEPEAGPSFPERRVARVVDTDPAYCIYTSGSTGAPKGVVVAHRSVVGFIDWAVETYALDASTVFGNQSPFHFDVSVVDIFGALRTGGTAVLIPERLFAFPVELVDYIKTARVNFIIWVPSVLAHVAATDAFAAGPPSGITKVLFAGEPMPAKHLNYWIRHLPDALYSNLYGPTEATVIAAFYVVDRALADHEAIPIGGPCRNVDLLVLDEAGSPTLPGETGELHIRGTSLALGYWNDPARTAEAFIQNPLERRYPERVYRTGDLVRRNERGELVFLGRRDSQIKYSGYRIELGEIESAAMTLSGVSWATAFFDDEQQRIVLGFVPRDGATDHVLVRRHLSAQLPRYMVPAIIRDVATMPLTPSGKADRLELRKQLEARLEAEGAGRK